MRHAVFSYVSVPNSLFQVVNTILNYLTTVRQKDFITHGRTIFKLSTPKAELYKITFQSS